MKILPPATANQPPAVQAGECKESVSDNLLIEIRKLRSEIKKLRKEMKGFKKGEKNGF